MGNPTRPDSPSAKHDLDAALRWAENTALAADDPPYSCEVQQLTLARVLIAQGRRDHTAGRLNGKPTWGLPTHATLRRLIGTASR